MPITDVYSAYAKPLESVSDIQAGYAKNALAQAQLQSVGLQAQQAQQAFADQQTARNALMQSGGDPTKYANALQASGNVSAYQAHLKQQAELAKEAAQTAQANSAAGQSDAGTLKTRLDLYHQQIGGINDPASALDYLKRGAADPVVGKYIDLNAETQKLQAALADPSGAGLTKWKEDQTQAAISAKDRVDNQIKAQEEQGRNTRNDATLKNAVLTTGMNNATSRANVATTQAGENSRAAASRGTQLTIAGFNPDGTPVGEGGGALSPAAIENAAARYNMDGTLPPSMGRGQQGPRDIRAIQNRAAELSMGTDPAQLRVNQIDVKSAGAALTQLTKSKTMNQAFEDNANKNADIALSLSKQNDRTGIPLINAGIQALRTGTGSPEATQFAAATQTFVNEYAKIMSGGMGNAPASDSARAHASDLLTTKMTPEQFEGNVKLLQREMRNRMAGFDNTEQALRSRMGGKPAPAEATPTSTAGVPPDIAAILQKHGAPGSK